MSPAKNQPLQIMLGQELWNSEIVALLVGMGHSVVPLKEDDGHLIISRRAWRVPKSITQADLLKEVGTIIKQARLLEHEDTTKDAEAGRSAKEHKPAKPRKPAAKKSTKGKGGAGAAKADQPDSGANLAADGGVIPRTVEEVSNGC